MKHKVRKDDDCRPEEDRNCHEVAFLTTRRHSSYAQGSEEDTRPDSHLAECERPVPRKCSELVSRRREHEQEHEPGDPYQARKARDGDRSPRKQNRRNRRSAQEEKQARPAAPGMRPEVAKRSARGISDNETPASAIRGEDAHPTDDTAAPLETVAAAMRATRCEQSHREPNSRRAPHQGTQRESARAAPTRRDKRSNAAYEDPHLAYSSLGCVEPAHRHRGRSADSQSGQQLRSDYRTRTDRDSLKHDD